MLGHGAVRVVEHDLAVARMADHAGLEVVAHQTWRGAAEPLVHRNVAPQPGVLPHVERRLHERVPAERQHRYEQVRLRNVAGDRIDDPHGLAGPIDLDGASGLVLDPARHTGPRHISGVLLAETVVTHARPARGGAFVGVLAVQDAQGHSDTRELAVDPGPVGLLVHAFPFAPAGEQHRVHLVVRFRLNVRIGDSRGRRGGQHLGHALPGDPQRSGDRPPGQTLVVEAEYRLGLDFPYHCR